MVVNLGKSQVFEREVAQAIDGGVGREFATANLLEELADGFGVHGRF
jgi:hypothetical protein